VNENVKAAKEARQNTRDQTSVIVGAVMTLLAAVIPEIPAEVIGGMTTLLTIMVHRTHKKI